MKTVATLFLALSLTAGAAHALQAIRCLIPNGLTPTSNDPTFLQVNTVLKAVWTEGFFTVYAHAIPGVDHHLAVTAVSLDEAGPQ